ncbi:hypothetical protein J2754_001267 [Halarchaeum solikamskense]|nr:hypothetical protein [Halarchaeum solikamskense]
MSLEPEADDADRERHRERVRRFIEEDGDLLDALHD